MTVHAPTISISRRTILAGAAVAPLALIPAGAAFGATNDAHALWRAYRAAEGEEVQKRREADRLMAALPDWAREPRVQYGRLRHGPEEFEPLYAYYAATLDGLYEQDAGIARSISGGDCREWLANRQAHYEEKKVELAEAQRLASEERERTGSAEAQRRYEAACDRVDVLHQRGRTVWADGSPVGTAALLDTALLGHVDPSDFLEDYPHRLTVVALFALLPQLPADMASTLARWREVKTFGEAKAVFFAAA